MSADSKLELVHLVKRYGGTTAVDRIDLRIAAGSYCCLLGPSGCGKPSTLREGPSRPAKATSCSATATSPTCRPPHAARQ